MSEFLVHVHGPICYPKQADHVFFRNEQKERYNHGIQDHDGRDRGKMSTPMLSANFPLCPSFLKVHSDEAPSGRGDRHGWTIGKPISVAVSIKLYL